MKELLSFWYRAIPFTLGVALSLIALCFLVKFYDYGLDLDEKYIWLFAIFFLTGFPALMFGLNKLSEESN